MEALRGALFLAMVGCSVVQMVGYLRDWPDRRQLWWRLAFWVTAGAWSLTHWDPILAGLVGAGLGMTYKDWRWRSYQKRVEARDARLRASFEELVDAFQARQVRVVVEGAVGSTVRTIGELMAEAREKAEREADGG